VSDDTDIRPRYVEHGVAGFYEQFGSQYRNPHEPQIRALLGRLIPEWRLDVSRTLDLACGSGEATLILLEHGAGVLGADPFTRAAYRERTGLEAEAWSFEDIAHGALEGRSFSLIVCSFALHLLEPSRLPSVAFALSRAGEALLILTPHKRPNLRPEWGWNLEHETLESRVRARLYRTRDPIRP
jgi:SAM-dependent methyltransferase